MVSIPETVALVIGKAFGKHNFSYFISPKKTWEGLAGQFLGIYCGYLMIMLMVFLFSVDMLDFKIGTILFYGFFIVVAAVLGDLIESVIKRALTVKDSSETAIIGSGLGGVLDKFDSFGVCWLTMSVIIRLHAPNHFPALS